VTRGAARAVLAAAVVAAAGCSDTAPPGGDASVARGRQVYTAQCTACHNPDPSLPGALGPSVRGASRELLEAKLLKGTYPEGYKPKRPTALMPPQPGLAPDVAALADFLR
jgi:mono/diheme cytochrome c family protein